LARLWTQRKGCGPAVQPTRGTVRLDPVHRQPPRAMADAHRGAGLARLYACPAGFDSQEEGWHAAAVPSHGKTRQEALESSFRAWLPLGKRFHHTLFSQRPQLRERDGFAFHRRESAYCGERQRGSDNGHYGNQAGLDRAGLPLIPINEGLLLANLLQRSRTAFSCVSFPGFFAFFEGMYDTQTSALRSSPTVPEGFLRHRPNSPQTLARLLTGTEIRQVNSSSMR
jgi:hypothetical protein